MTWDIGAIEASAVAPPPVPVPTPMPAPVPAPTPSANILLALPPGRTVKVVRNRKDTSVVEVHINKSDVLKVQP